MNFDPITASAKIMKYYLRYIETAFFISDEDYFDQFKRKLADESAFSKGPFLEATDSFKVGNSLEQLISAFSLLVALSFLFADVEQCDRGIFNFQHVLGIK